MFMCFEFELGCKVNSGPFVLSLTPPSPVFSVSFVIHPLLPRDGQEAGNRSRANNREEGRWRKGRYATGNTVCNTCDRGGMMRTRTDGFYPAELKPFRRLRWSF